MYHPDLDSPTQRAALLDFYDSTGGQKWANQPVDDVEHGQISQLVDGVIEAGYELVNGSLDVTTLPAELVSDAASIPSLSSDCALQQYLSLGQLWLTHSWGSNVSYCYWTGITCCQTVSSGHCLWYAPVFLYLNRKEAWLDRVFAFNRRISCNSFVWAGHNQSCKLSCQVMHFEYFEDVL